MIESMIFQHLQSALTVPVYLEQPDQIPAHYVLLEKTGSSRTNRLIASTFAFQSYAESLYLAAELNERVKAAVDSLVMRDEIGSVQLNSDYNFTDTETKQYRYQAVYDISHY